MARDRLAIHYGSLGRSVPTDAVAGLEDGSSLRFHGFRFAERALAGYGSRVEAFREELSCREAGSLR